MATVFAGRVPSTLRSALEETAVNTGRTTLAQMRGAASMAQQVEARGGSTFPSAGLQRAAYEYIRANPQLQRVVQSLRQSDLMNSLNSIRGDIPGVAPYLVSGLAPALPAVAAGAGLGGMVALIAAGINAVANATGYRNPYPTSVNVATRGGGRPPQRR